MSLQEKASPSALIFIPHLLSALPRSFPLQPTDLGGEKHAKSARPLQLLAPPPPGQALFPRKGGQMCRHLAGGGASGAGGGVCMEKTRRDASWKCARQLMVVGGWGGGGHCLSLYLTVISTLGMAHKRAGYSFPFLPSALQGGLQCGWGGGSDNSQHVYTGPKKINK